MSLLLAPLNGRCLCNIQLLIAACGNLIVTHGEDHGVSILETPMRLAGGYWGGCASHQYCSVGIGDAYYTAVVPTHCADQAVLYLLILPQHYRTGFKSNLPVQ